MKWISPFFAVIAFQLISVLAAPATEIVKRTSTSESASVGYATLNGGTTGGAGGTTTTVTTLAALTSAVSGDSAKIVIISGTITGNTVVKVGSNTSVLGASGSLLSGVGLRVLEESNVIIRNVKIQKVLADAGDAIGIQEAHNVWVDHVDLSSDLDHDKDYYYGLLDITHGSYGITVTNSKLYNHWKASLVGHSDSNGSEDVALRVTFALNWWQNLNSRGPSFRFGQGHIFNNYYVDLNDGINTRDEAQLLIENNVFTGTEDAIYSTDSGYAVASGNDLGDDGTNTAPTGTISASSLGYSYTLLATNKVASYVQSNAGQTLSF
ncbi:polysaccharide lyase family 1 protein [Desarmillaria tabescens]|uniref:pectate lyase n=1 Tax=Armillaria tabescens TaxID=1929756 RepID=A0AA39K6V9_ARMTA|nr:polysaccharide lyase family 1 protein [Desarmillaria tabescens]KAK0455662.1 polysaccharide lyase family 1 protein [Desarmillaria tabescens]